jgi:iron complex outermembrane receptor protein
MRYKYLLAASIYAFMPAICAAQATPAASDQDKSMPAASDQGGLNDIVVTAQKRSESLQKVPISITALTAEKLSEAHITNNAQLAALTPGLFFSQSTIGAQPWLRGIGNSSGVPGNEPAVATYVDGVYRPSPVSAWFSYNGIERLEIEKGPQGTLFGRNAAGGVINIVTKDPGMTPELKLNAGYGNYDTFSGSFYGSTGIGDTLAADLSVSGSKQNEGFGKDLQTGADIFINNNLSARTKIVWRPTSKTRVVFTADYDYTRSEQGVVLMVLPGTTSNSGFTHVGGFYDVNSVVPQYGRQKQGGVALT